MIFILFLIVAFQGLSDFTQQLALNRNLFAHYQQQLQTYHLNQQAKDGFFPTACIQSTGTVDRSHEFAGLMMTTTTRKDDDCGASRNEETPTPSVGTCSVSRSPSPAGDIGVDSDDDEDAAISTAVCKHNISNLIKTNSDRISARHHNDGAAVDSLPHHQQTSFHDLRHAGMETSPNARSNNNNDEKMVEEGLDFSLVGPDAAPSGTQDARGMAIRLLFSSVRWARAIPSFSQVRILSETV